MRLEMEKKNNTLVINICNFQIYENDNYYNSRIVLYIQYRLYKLSRVRMKKFNIHCNIRTYCVFNERMRCG